MFLLLLAASCNDAQTHCFNSHFSAQPGLAGCPILSLHSSFSWASSQNRPKLFIPVWYFGLYPTHLH